MKIPRDTGALVVLAATAAAIEQIGHNELAGVVIGGMFQLRGGESTVTMLPGIAVMCAGGVLGLIGGVLLWRRRREPAGALA